MSSKRSKASLVGGGGAARRECGAAGGAARLRALESLPGSLGSYLFGPKLVRAEVLVKDDGALHDYRIDRGVVRDKSPGSLTLRERDATVVTIAVAPNASISLNGRSTSFSALRRGMVATVIRDGDSPAGEVRAAGR